MVLLATSSGLGTHRIPSAHVVPEAALDYAAEFLGPQIRGGDLVTLLALGWPDADRPLRPVSVGVEPVWVGDGAVPLDDMPSTPSDDLRPPAEVLRAHGRERVLVVDPYPYNRALLEAQLTRAGYEVEVFSDGASLLQRVEASGAPALYIVSDTLRDTHGFELVRRLTGARRGQARAGHRHRGAARLGVSHRRPRPPASTIICASRSTASSSSPRRASSSIAIASSTICAKSARRAAHDARAPGAAREDGGARSARRRRGARDQHAARPPS